MSAFGVAAFQRLPLQAFSVFSVSQFGRSAFSVFQRFARGGGVLECVWEVLEEVWGGLEVMLVPRHL